ncbi:Zn-ribbon domain-containing OB-fold protein [Novosphingobium album (ex Liu et al. 2023)]|uniref:Zinc ribbon domain-containing protein n=1 Tax=Novosphingobium album (ex Liu et al. 2023) TaxID=3031130 RepID=A0ABT5WRN4_9SPHN|nr:zinc ribbon domain-containing protein [Novosphingobium album (ex Liu et al. 2023)]MDE8652715.1 zinc ribbon domain-containing protein [Novosphingobium album (ex Liu et al. 2023)]
MAPAPPPPPRKLPLLEPGSAFYWTSGAEGALRIQRCTACGTYQHPPFPHCAACGSEDVAPAAVSGKGRLATYTINYEPWIPGLPVPFVFGVVELAEQRELYVFTNVLAPVDQVRHGMAVAVTFEPHEDVWLPMFRPEDAPA